MEVVNGSIDNGGIKVEVLIVLDVRDLESILLAKLGGIFETFGQINGLIENNWTLQAN